MSRIIKLALLFFGLGLLTLSYPCKSQVLENYDGQWTAVSSKRFYMPPEALQVDIGVQSFPLSNLRLSIPSGSSLFLDDILWHQTSTDTVLLYTLQEIREVFGENRDSVRVTVYNPRIAESSVSVRKIGRNDVVSTVTPGTTVALEGITQRPRTEFGEFFVLALLVLMALAAIFRVIHPVVLPMFLDPRNLLSSEEFIEGGSFSKFFTNALLFYLLMLNMLLMLLFITVCKSLDIAPMGMMVSNKLNELLFLWIAGTLVLMGVSFLKFIWLKINVYIFGINKFEIPHYLYVLRILSYSMLLISSLLAFTIPSQTLEIKDVIILFLKVFFGSYVFMLIVLMVLMRKRLAFKNYHLFSYICTSELIPFLVISRLLIG